MRRFYRVPLFLIFLMSLWVQGQTTTGTSLLKMEEMLVGVLPNYGDRDLKVWDQYQGSDISASKEKKPRGFPHAIYFRHYSGHKISSSSFGEPVFDTLNNATVRQSKLVLQFNEVTRGVDASYLVNPILEVITNKHTANERRGSFFNVRWLSPSRGRGDPAIGQTDYLMVCAVQLRAENDYFLQHQQQGDLLIPSSGSRTNAPSILAKETLFGMMNEATQEDLIDGRSLRSSNILLDGKIMPDTVLLELFENKDMKTENTNYDISCLIMGQGATPMLPKDVRRNHVQKAEGTFTWVSEATSGDHLENYLSKREQGDPAVQLALNPANNTWFFDGETQDLALPPNADLTAQGLFLNHEMVCELANTSSSFMPTHQCVGWSAQGNVNYSTHMWVSSYEPKSKFSYMTGPMNMECTGLPASITLTGGQIASMIMGTGGLGGQLQSVKDVAALAEIVSLKHTDSMNGLFFGYFGTDEASVLGPVTFSGIPALSSFQSLDVHGAMAMLEASMKKATVTIPAHGCTISGKPLSDAQEASLLYQFYQSLKGSLPKGLGFILVRN